MARIQTAVDDFERSKPGKGDSQYAADRSVEISVIVRDLQGNILPDQSLKPRRLDMGPANTDNLKQKVLDYWKAGTEVSGSGGSRSGSRRSSGGGGRARSNTSTAAAGPGGGTTTQKRAFNKAIREWAEGQERFSEVSDQGRIPNEVTNAYKEAHPDWEARFFPQDGSAPATEPAAGGAHAAPEPTEAPVATSPAVNVDPGPQDLSDDDDDEDPPLEQTRDEDWGAGPRPTQFAGTT